MRYISLIIFFLFTLFLKCNFTLNEDYNLIKGVEGDEYVVKIQSCNEQSGTRAFTEKKL